MLSRPLRLAGRNRPGVSSHGLVVAAETSLPVQHPAVRAQGGKITNMEVSTLNQIRWSANISAAPGIGVTYPVRKLSGIASYLFFPPILMGFSMSPKL